MAARGRPKTDGVKEPWVFFRTGIALCAYDKARSTGEKYEVAVQAAVDAVQRQLPDVHMNRTEMKRILADFRSNSLENALFFEESECKTSVDGVEHQQAWVIRIGDTPNYPRHNARSEPIKYRSLNQR